MIAKRIPLRNPRMSSFSRLTEYITNDQGKNERVGVTRITNCQAEAPAWAAHEIEKTQARNHRTKIDRTYHLLVSFREGERPSVDVLHQIENRLVKAIGLADHQRISAIHYDTDHVHMHVAVNKIHPTKFTAIEPYFDMPKLGAECAKLEIELNLLQDNHIPKRTRAEARAMDMEMAAGVESLIGWVKRGCLGDLLAATSWKELHAVLNGNGLKLQPQNNGFVITDGKGHGAKASSFDRQLSKHALEKKLGPYRAISEGKGRGSEGERAGGVRYSIKPVASKVDTRALWAQYQQERAAHRQKQFTGTKEQLARRDRLIAAAKKSAKLKRMGIRLLQGRLTKKIMYHAVSKKLLTDIKKINQAYIRVHLPPTANSNRMVWHDWLKAKAQAGNMEAVAVLRARYERQAQYGNAITSITAGNDNQPWPKGRIDGVTKKGTIHYKVADGIVRDDGKQLRMGDNLSDEALKTVLSLAVKRFGPQLELQGTDKFKSAMVRIADSAFHGITFVEPKAQAAIKGNGMGQNMPSSAAEKYITERNEKRAKIPSILLHRHYKDEDAGKYAFAGVRRMEKTNLLLLKSSSEVLVMTIDDKTAYRTKYLDIGNQINITADGAVQPRAEGLVRAHRLVRER